MRDVHKLILDDIRQRTTWEERQRVWFDMRHNGLRRRNKPFPGAADLHFPLADGFIEKLKPFYFQQLFATETLASFISWKDQAEDETSRAAYWFDYKLKQKSNLETEILTTIDDMLMSGRPVLKVFWDATKKAVQFDAITPTNVIVPFYTKELQDADRLVHVMTLSEGQYKAREDYKQDADFIKRIKGKGTALDGTSTTLEQTKQRREGITFGKDDEEIIVWEVYTRDAERNWQIDTFSPLAPEEAIRARFKLAYRHGMLPFIDFPREIKDKGYYSPRGIPEIVAPHETSLNKMWNEKHDCMTFYNRPMFTSEKEIPNSSNIRMLPGAILPYAIQAVQLGSPPINFDEEMNSTRSVAEQRINIPDFGIGDPNAASDAKTATEVNKIGQEQSMAIDLNARIFRKCLTNIYRQAWSLLLQYDQDTRFIFEDQPSNIDEGALHDEYLISPNGSADSWNKGVQLQKAVARKQLLGTSPYVDQSQLDKSLLELDDPRLVRRLWVDPNHEQADQAKQQAMEIPAIAQGYPIPVDPSDDDAIHVQTALQWAEAQGNKGAPLDPHAIAALKQHIGAHVQQAIKKDPKKGKMLANAVKAQIAPHAAAGNGLAAAATGVPAPQQAPAPIPPKIIESINFKDLPQNSKNVLLQTVGLPPGPSENPMLSK